MSANHMKPASQERAPVAGRDYWPDGYQPGRRWKPPSQWPIGWLLLAFGAIFLALQTLWRHAEGSLLELWVVGHGTVQPAAQLIHWLSPDLGAYAVRFSIRAQSGGPGINILNGCEGLDVLFLLWAALAVSGLRWRSLLLGFCLGTPLVWLLNQGRVVALFYANRVDKELFALLHGTVGPLVLITLIALAFLLLLKADARAGQSTAPTPAHR